MTSKELSKVLFDPGAIEKIVSDVSSQIKLKRFNFDNTYTTGKRLVLLAPLKGSYIFLSDLSRALNRLDVPHIIEFMSVRSYNNTKSTGEIEVLCDVRENLSGDHVIVVEDIVDTGLTLNHLINLIYTKNPKTLEVCTLLRKPTQLQVSVKVDYVGADIDPEFVVGYGLDYNEWFRGVDCIGIPTQEAIEKYKQ